VPEGSATMRASYRRRRLVERLMFGATCGATAAALGVLLFLLGYLTYRGASSLSWDFFTQLPAPVGETGGGMANAIVGSGKLLLVAALLGVPIGFLGGVYLSEYGRGPIAFAVRYAADVLNGVPSIVIGITVYALLVVPVGHFSTLAGGFALGLMMIPVALRTTEEFLRLVPDSLREAALALGAPRWVTIVRVVIPAGLRGIVTGIILSLARVAGETAPLLFTALNNRFWSEGWTQPTASLPVMIFTYAIAPYDDWHRQAWAAGLVLLILVLGANILARLLMRRGASLPAAG
jgi:phosphate transport system permease protein